jgi:hypothetical protein
VQEKYLGWGYESSKTNLCYNLFMVMFSMLTWWYFGGLSDQFGRIKKMLAKVSDQFSIPLLIKTLFYPFRMIDADKVYGPSLGDKIKAWLDKVISCMIGGAIRTVVVIVGVIVLIITVALGALRMAFWVALPILPILVLVGVVVGGAIWT